MSDIFTNAFNTISGAVESAGKPFIQILTNPEKALKNTLKSVGDFATNPVKSIEDTLNHWGKTLKNDPNIAKVAAIVVNMVPGIGQATSAAITASIVAAQSRAEGKSFEKSFLNAGIAAALSVGASELKDYMKSAGVSDAEFAAADAKQLAAQGMTKAQIVDTIKNSYDLGNLNIDSLADAALSKGSTTLDKITQTYNKLTGSKTDFSDPATYDGPVPDPLNNPTQYKESTITLPDSNTTYTSPLQVSNGTTITPEIINPDPVVKVDLTGLDSLATGVSNTGAQVGTNLVDFTPTTNLGLDAATTTLGAGAGAGSMYGAGSGATLAETLNTVTNPLTTAGAAVTGAGAAGLPAVLNNPLVTASAAVGAGLNGSTFLDSLSNVKTLKDIAGLWNSANTADQQRQTAADVLKYSNPYYNYQQQYEIPLKIAEGQYAQEQQKLAGDTLQQALAAANNASQQGSFDQQLATTQAFNKDFDSLQGTGTGLQGQFDTQLSKTNTLADQLAAERTQVNPMIGQFNAAATNQLAQNDLYNQQLATSYNDPLAVYNTPEMQALSDMFMGTINRRDAAAGRNSQYGARAVEAQNNFLSNLNTYRGTLNSALGTGANAATGYGNTAVGYQNAATNQLNAGNQLLGNYNTTLGNITGQYNANTGAMNAVTSAQNANNAILGNITGQQNANTAITNSLNSIYGNQNQAINNALDFASATGQKADTGTYANVSTGATKSDAATVGAGVNVLGEIFGPLFTGSSATLTTTKPVDALANTLWTTG